MSGGGNSTVRGLVVDSYGDWRKTRIGEIARRPLAPGEILIDARAAALNFPDLLMIEGKYQHRPPLPFVAGRDVAGTIAELGDGADHLKIGDRVAAQPLHGAFAAKVIAPANHCTRLPDAVSFEQGAAAATILATVVGALKLRAKLGTGETVLVRGAAGGVGSAAIGYAKLLGGRVVALVSSAEKEASVRALGADTVLRSDTIEGGLREGLRKSLLAAGLEGVDVVIDVVGGEVFEGAIRCVLPAGRYVVVGSSSGHIPQIAANYLLLKDIAVIGSSLRRLFRSGNPQLREYLDSAFLALADGRLLVPIDRRLPLSRFAEGAALIADRKVIGKLVLDLTNI
jgi:NADPH2:quinone reductase